MSEDLERLGRDLARDDGLFRELSTVGNAAADVGRWLQQRSYQLGDDEIAAVAAALGQELSDEELDAVSGGTGGSLQTSMDRRSRLLSTLTNIMGANHDTASTLIDNLR